VKENAALLRQRANSERLPAFGCSRRGVTSAVALSRLQPAVVGPIFLTKLERRRRALRCPIFTGRRIKGDEMVAQANLNDEAKTRLQQTRELAVLDCADRDRDIARSAGRVGGRCRGHP